MFITDTPRVDGPKQPVQIRILQNITFALEMPLSFLVLFLQLMDFQISFLNLLAGLCIKLVPLQLLMVRINHVFLFFEKEVKA